MEARLASEMASLRTDRRLSSDDYDGEAVEAASTVMTENDVAQSRGRVGSK